MPEETPEEKAAREKQEAEDKAAAEAAEKKPPWKDGEFDEERAAKLIENLRSDLDRQKKDRAELETKVKEHEDASKSDYQKLEERATSAEKRASEAEGRAARLTVALRKGLTETQAKRLVGDSEEDLEKDADELLDSFKTETEGEPGQESRRRPTERLRPGAAPAAEPEETDPAKLAEQVPRGW